MSFKFSLSSIVTILAAGKALEADIKPLYDLIGTAMQTVEAQYANTEGSGANKKTAVLNIVGFAATELGKDWGILAADVSLLIDGAKTLYNAVIKAVTPASTPQS